MASTRWWPLAVAGAVILVVPTVMGPSCLPQPSPVPVMTPELRASRLRGCGPAWDVGWASTI